MSDDEVIAEAALEGFELDERACVTRGCGAGAPARTLIGPCISSSARR